MWTIIIVVFFVCVLVGAGLAVTAYRSDGANPVASALLVTIVTLIGCLFAAWPVYPTAHHFSKEAAVGGYREYLNGSVVDARVDDFPCYKAKESSGGSNCSHTYRCDSYQELEHYQESYTETEHYTDTNGKRQSRTVTKYRDKTRWVTRWHECPYATYEYTYEITVRAWKLYDFTLAQHIFAANPEPWGNKRIPGDVPRGAPEKWQRAHEGLATGFLEPGTVKHEYKNFILGSENKFYAQQSDQIEKLKAAHLLPAHTTPLGGVRDDYLADKMSFVGFAPSNAADWQDRLMRENASLGSDRQGDMHSVAVRNSQLQAAGVSQHEYANALKASWMQEFGKDAFAKNGIGLVMGVDDTGTTILWAEAFTGMPNDVNGVMLSRLNTLLRNQPFDPSVVFGKVGARVETTRENGKTKYHVTYSNPTSADGGIVPFVTLTEFPFVRACMGCEGDEDKGQVGFKDLMDLVPITTGGKVTASIIWSIIMSVAMFAAFMMLMPMISSATPRSSYPQDTPSYLQDGDPYYRQRRRDSFPDSY